MIKVENLSKVFNKGKQNKFYALKDVSIVFPEKGLVSLVGPSGCGKTTLLNMLSGLDKANKGKITVDDLTLKHYNARKWDALRNKKIGYIFQNYYLLNDESVEENLDFPLKSLGLSKEDRALRIEKALSYVGLEKLKRRKARQLSGGQQQRVAIARAISKGPEIIFADEPTGNLDDKTSHLIMDILRKIADDRLVILVTHNKELCDIYSDFIIKMKDGVVSEVFENELKQNYKGYEKDVVYLDEFNKSEYVNCESKIKLFSDNTEKINATLILRNGTLYIDIENKNLNPILVSEKLDLRIKDTRPQKIETKPQDKHFKIEPIKNARPKSVIRFQDAFKLAFKKFLYPTKLRKFFNIGLMFLSFFLYIGIAVFYKNFEITELSYKEGANSVYILNQTESHKYKYDDFFKVLKDEKIKNVNSIANVQKFKATCGVLNLFSERAFYIKYFSLMPLDDKFFSDEQLEKLGVLHKINQSDLKLIGGRNLKDKSEVIVSSEFADFLIRNQKEEFKNYDDVLSSRIFFLDRSEFKIVGIAKNKNAYIYLDVEMYFKYQTLLSYNEKFDFLTEYMNVSYYKVIDDINHAKTIYDTNKPNPNASIFKEGLSLLKSNIVSTNLTLSPTENEIIIPDSYLNIMHFFNQSGTDVRFLLQEENNKLYLVVSSFSGSVKFKVKGFIKSDFVVSKESFVLFKNFILKSARNFSIISENSNLKKHFHENIYNLNQNNYQKTRTDWKERGLVFALVFPSIFILFSFIFLFFAERSTLIAEIYKLGVYRVLGIKKYECFKIFLSEIILLSILTSLPGILFGTYFTYNLREVIDHRWWFSVVTGCVILVVNLISGLIPITFLLRKTPVQIITKYDI